MSDILNVIQTRSSIRGYKKDELTAEQIATLVNAGLMAPTAINRQELHFTVVKTSDPIIEEMCKDLNPASPAMFHYGAPIMILISGEDAFKWMPVDAGIAVQNIHLAAAQMGLGSVIIGCVYDILNGDKKDYYAKKLEIPEGYSFRVGIVVGHPAVTKEPHEIDVEKNVSIL